ncbi:LysE family translocator [Patulibacter americanus]|uniref:LysE family translocator n=1 Tax=Patulibacter americanus TaxID=588672 RepID=UPI0003B39574|nr:LysE family translocator [Patulibacter americanus]
MSLEAVGTFWVVSFLLAMLPGADWAYAIAAGLKHRSIAPAMAGVSAGYLLHTVVAAAGVAAIVAGSSSALAVLSVVGAAYLLWLGVRALTGPAPVLAAADDGPVASSPVGEAARGFGVSALNPKVLLTFLALLPQFVDTDASWPVGVQILALGTLHNATCVAVCSVVGTGARAVLRARPTAATVVTRASGLMMMGIGLVLAGEQVAAVW